MDSNDSMPHGDVYLTLNTRLMTEGWVFYEACFHFIPKADLVHTGAQRAEFLHLVLQQLFL